MMLLVGHRGEDAKAQTLLARFSASVRVVNHVPMTIPDSVSRQQMKMTSEDQ